MTESANKAQQQDNASTSKSFSKMPLREPEEQTVITITTDSQTTDTDEPTHNGENTPETGELTETDEVTEVYVPTDNYRQPNTQYTNSNADFANQLQHCTQRPYKPSRFHGHTEETVRRHSGSGGRR